MTVRRLIAEAKQPEAVVGVNALRCRSCGSEVGATAVGPDAVAFTCSWCLLFGGRGAVAAHARPVAGEWTHEVGPDDPDVAPGTEELIRSGRSGAGRRVEMWLARGSYQGARPYFAVFGCQSDDTRGRQARYTPFADLAEGFYRELLDGPAVEEEHHEAPVQEGRRDWPRVRVQILRRDGHQCRKCPRRDSLTVHHIKPRAAGGSDNPANLLTLCATCHDWAEIETAERGLSWAELISPTPTPAGEQGGGA